MNKLPFVEQVIGQEIDGTALTNTTTATSILAAAAKWTMPSNFLEIGRGLRVRASGRISTHSAPGTLTLDLRLGSIVVFNGGASPTLAASQTNVAWELDVWLKTRAKGGSTTANFYGQGKLITAGLSALIQMLPATSPGVGSGFDSTAAQVLDLFATWSVANAANSIRCDDFDVFVTN